MSDKDEKEIASGAATEADRPESVGRRALLRGGVAAMPAILTLQSGAALAKSSSMMVTPARPDTTDKLGRTLCLDTNSVYPAQDHPRGWELGTPPHAKLNIISDRVYYRAKSKRSGKVKKGEMCRGGTFWHKEKGKPWESVHLPYKGAVMSHGSMYSIADYVTDTLI